MSLSDNGISRNAYAGVACAVVEYFVTRIIIPKCFVSKIFAKIIKLVVKILWYYFIRGQTLLQPPAPLKSGLGPKQK